MERRRAGGGESPLRAEPWSHGRLNLRNPLAKLFPWFAFGLWGFHPVTGRTIHSRPSVPLWRLVLFHFSFCLLGLGLRLRLNCVEFAIAIFKGICPCLEQGGNRALPPRAKGLRPGYGGRLPCKYAVLPKGRVPSSVSTCPQLHAKVANNAAHSAPGVTQ